MRAIVPGVALWVLDQVHVLTGFRRLHEAEWRFRKLVCGAMGVGRVASALHRRRSTTIEDFGIVAGSSWSLRIQGSTVGLATYKAK